MMSANHTAQLLELLAEYATEHGKDCDPGMTVVELANDLADSLNGEYAPASVPLRWAETITAEIG